ncbi:hypothetical protein NQZ68_017500 [Dissostichus eleginoides]|nr:hypothetical protein NQZ68_017500 [Dissostichus eleginoides]
MRGWARGKVPDEGFPQQSWRESRRPRDSGQLGVSRTWGSVQMSPVMLIGLLSSTPITGPAIHIILTFHLRVKMGKIRNL